MTNIINHFFTDSSTNLLISLLLLGWRVSHSLEHNKQYSGFIKCTPAFTSSLMHMYSRRVSLRYYGACVGHHNHTYNIWLEGSNWKVSNESVYSFHFEMLLFREIKLPVAPPLRMSILRQGGVR